MGRRILGALAALLALAIVCSPALASTTATVVHTPLVPICKASPQDAAKLRSQYRSAGDIAAFCRRYGKPVQVSAPRSTLCLSGGCAWIVLYNQGNGWGLAQYGADPYAQYGAIWYGHVGITRYNNRTRQSAGWVDSVARNCGSGWCGYRYQYPGWGWNQDTMTGWTYTTAGYVESIGPVSTWSYIT